MASAAEPDHRYGTGRPFSLGVEEELFLVDPVTGRLINSAPAVLERLSQPAEALGEVAPELHACQLELITAPQRTASEAMSALAELRGAVRARGVGTLHAGTHPTALEGEAEITDKERYTRIHYLLGDAAATPISGLHVHVGMPDPETAIGAFNGLRRDLPLLQALAANSPLRHGRDTGLASAREVTLRGWARSAPPRAMRNFEDFCHLARVLTRAADVPDYTWFWWKLRPHPRLGTVEIRALDVQTSLADTGALTALVHCLARDAAENPPAIDPRPELVEEGVFRAARFGVEGSLPDARGRLHPVPDLVEEALARARRWAPELGCEAELAQVPDLLRRGGGTGAQRATYALAGIDAVVRELCDV